MKIVHICSSLVILALESGITCRFHGPTIRIWFRLHAMLGRSSISLSFLKWCFLLGGISGKLEMIKLSGILDLPSDSGEMVLSMTFPFWLTESSQNTEML